MRRAIRRTGLQANRLGSLLEIPLYLKGYGGSAFVSLGSNPTEIAITTM